MKISERGINLLKSFEGLELEAYQDIAGIWTIGYGHTGDDVEPGMRISEREAEALLRKDLKPREDAIDRFASVSLNQNEFDALVSFVYNVGAAAFGGSTARKRLNRGGGDRIGAADALAWWNKATVNGVLREVLGLTRRRAAERALFLEPSNPPIVRDPKKIDENSRITPIEDTPRRGNVAESRTVQGATVAGGAGAAASTLGSDSVKELNQTETNIESGHSMTEHEPTQDGDTTVGVDEDGNPVIGGETDTQTGQMVEMQVDRPSKHDVHAVEAQLQFALLVLIILSALFVIYARFDDWLNYRR
ncbi:MAG: lysozyme [Alphaproteobacteria bacterium]|nr:lysozyme [Alphaproteobacteria bacterium]